MENLYLVIVGEKWKDRFQRTVEQPVEISDDAPDFLVNSRYARIWGSTEDKEGVKRSHFNEMTEGDGVVFHNNNVVFGVGKAGKKYDPDMEGPAIGDWLWQNPESSLVFEVLDYVSDISIPIEDVWRDLGFKENYIQNRSCEAHC
jgi:hypothetical protein